MLVGGILLLLISPFSLIASWLGIALEWFVKILNEGIFLVERLPFSLISDVYISAFQCYLLFAIVIAGLLLIFIHVLGEPADNTMLDLRERIQM